MEEPQNSFVLTEKGQKKLLLAKKDYGRDLSYWICLAGAGGFVSFKFLDEVVFPRLVLSFSQRRRYTVASSLLVGSMTLYHGYKLSQRNLLKKKIEISRKPENVLEQLY